MCGRCFRAALTLALRRGKGLAICSGSLAQQSRLFTAFIVILGNWGLVGSASRAADTFLFYAVNVESTTSANEVLEASDMVISMRDLK